MKKKHLVIVCGVFYPQPSATGYCAKRFAQLLKDIYDIDIICISSDGRSISVSADDNKQRHNEFDYNIHMIGGTRIRLETLLPGIGKKIVHSIGAAQIKLTKLGNLTWYKNGVVKKLNELHSKSKIDVILTICSPMAAHQAGIEFVKSHEEVIHCGYTVDPYSSYNRIRPFRMSFDALVSYEKKTLSSMRHVLLSKEIIDSRPELVSYLNNYECLPYMLPDFYEVKEGIYNFDQDTINCVYAGSFYSDIRNPSYMLKVFSLLQNHGINLYLFSRGCEKEVSQYAEKCLNIFSMGTVPSEQMNSVYSAADILIGVGNKTADFLPSKTFEYMAVGKPIIYFNYESCENDVLKDYPLEIQVTDNVPIECAASNIEKFCNDNKGKRVARGDLEQLYEENSPGNIKKILLCALEDK